MAVTTATRPTTAAAPDLQETAKRAPLDALHAAWAATTRNHECRSSPAARGPTSGTSTASAISTASRRCSACNAGHGRAGARRGRGARRSRSSTSTRSGATRIRGRSSSRRGSPTLAPGRPQPRLLHLRRLGGGRVGDQARARLPPRTGNPPQDQVHHAARSPTTAPPWARCAATGHHRPAQRRSSRSCPAGSRSPNTNSYHWPADRDPLWAADADRGEDRVRGPRHGRRGDPRAAPERRRLHPAAGRLLPARARDLRPPRRAADLRRGDLRLGPARPLVRLRALRLPAGHHHHGEGADLAPTCRWAR